MAPNFVYFVIRSLAYNIARSFFKLKIINRERLIDDGPCIIVANHQSFLDPPMIGQLYETNVHALARHSLWKPYILGKTLPFCQCIPINQTRPDAAAVIKVIRTIKEGGRVIIFPEGSRCEDGQIQKAMPGIGLILSKLAGVPIQPIRIEGAYDCLPIHSKKLRFRPITLSIGEPFYLSETDLKARSREEQRALGEKIMDSIKALRTDY